MRISVVIPTRNRQWLARRAINSVLAAGHDDLEIIVLDNSDECSPGSPFLTQDEFLSDPRISVVSSDRALSMIDNWERALPLANGRYITYASDKDIFLPNSLSSFASAVDGESFPDLVAYRKAWYNEEANRLTTYHVDGKITEHSSREFLQPWYACPGHMHSMPSLYGGFASADLVRRSRRCSYPTFFIGNSPDIGSAVVLCGHSRTYRQFHFHVAVAHAGSWSTGRDAASLGMHSSGSKRVVNEYGRQFDEEMGLPGVLGTVIAEVLLEARRAYPEQLGEYTIDWQQFLPSLKRELDALQISAEMKQKEWARIYSRNSIVPRSAVRMYSLLSLARRIKRGGVRLLSSILRSGGALKPYDSAPEASPNSPPWHYDWMRQSPCDSLESALQRTAELNSRSKL